MKRQLIAATISIAALLVATGAGAAPTVLKFTNPAFTVAAGDCSPANTLVTQNSSGVEEAVTANTPIAMAAPSATWGFFTDAACTTLLSSYAIPAGSSQLVFYFKDSAAGTRNLVASAAAPFSPTSLTHTITAAPPAQVKVTAPPSVVAGNCASTLTVELLDRLGNRVPATAATSVALATTSATGKFKELTQDCDSYGNCGAPYCTTATATLTTVGFAIGESVKSIGYLDCSAGTWQLSGTAASLTSVAATVAISGKAPNQVAFATASQVLSVNTCSAQRFTVELRETTCNVRMPAINPVTLNLTTNGTGAFYADAACSGAAITSVAIAAGQATADFYYKPTAIGTGTTRLTAAEATVGSAYQDQQIFAAPPSKLVFTNAANPIPLGAGVCSPAMTLQAQTSTGTASGVLADTVARLSGNSAGVSFYTAAGCTGTAVTQINFAKGDHTKTLYYKDTVAGSSTITAAADGLTAATYQRNISAGAVSKLHFYNPLGTGALRAGQCSGTHFVRTGDTFGNPVVVNTNLAVAVSSSSTTTRFFSDQNCTTALTGLAIVSGQNQSSPFFFKDDVAGTPTLTAKATGSTTIADGTLAQTFNAGPPVKMAITSAAQDLVAGDCSGKIDVQVQDALGNGSPLSAAATLTLTSTSPRMTFYSDASCGTAVTTLPLDAAVHTASFYFRDEMVGRPTLVVSTEGVTNAEQQQTIRAGAPAQIAFSTLPQTVTAGTCSPQVGVETQDLAGNASPMGAATLVDLSSSSTTMAFYADSSCSGATLTQVTIAMGGSSAGFYFRDTRAGTPTITIKAATLADGMQTQTVRAGNAAKLVFLSAAQNLTAGACSAAATVQAQDALDNPVSAAAPLTVNLTATSSTLTFYAAAGCSGAAVTTATIAANASTATFYWKDNTAGTPTVRGAAAAVTQASQQQTVRAGAAQRVAFRTQPQTVTVGQCSAIVTLALEDQFGNAATNGASLPVTVTFSRTSATVHADAACGAAATPAFAAGSSTLDLYFKDSRAGSLVMTAAAGSLQSAQQTETVLPATATALVFTSAAQTLPLGVCSAPMEIQPQDALGNAAPLAQAAQVLLTSSSQRGSFYTDAACLTATTSVQLAANATSAVFYYKDGAAGTADLLGEFGSLIPATQTVTVQVNGTAAALAFATPAQTVDAGACSGKVQVEARDAQDRPALLAAAATLALTSESVTLGFYSDAACTTQITETQIAANDYLAAFYFKDAVALPTKITATNATLGTATQDATIACPASTDGAYCDNATLCDGRETCQAGVCSTGTALSCDDNDPCTTDSCDAATGCDHVIIPTCCSRPVFVQNANPTAAVGVPYRYSDTGRVALSRGEEPLSFSLCDTPVPGFHIDATTGAVDWVPSAAITAMVCLKATGQCGEDTYRFTVTTAAPSSLKPAAAIALNPTSAAVGATVSANGSASTPNPLFAYAWNWGDGSPVSMGAQATHAYKLPGNYRVTLTVLDAQGQSAQASAAVAITDAACTTPPSVRIVAEPATGQGSLATQLRAEYGGSDANAVFQWTLGDGTTAVGRTTSHTYQPGSYRVQLRAVAADGCVSRHELELAVSATGNRPPHCAVSADPVAGPAPVDVVFRGEFGDTDGTIATARWTFSDGVQADAKADLGVISHTATAPGALTATLVATDDKGLTCTASAAVEALGTGGKVVPVIVSRPTLTAACNEAYTYGDDGKARAVGTRPLTWTLGKADGTAKPEGMTVDANGQITWTPTAAGSQKVAIVADNGAGKATQEFEVAVTCESAGSPDAGTGTTEPPPDDGCGCSTQGGLAMLALGLIAVPALRLRRRRD